MSALLEIDRENAALQALESSPHPELHTITASESDSEIILEGCVSSFYLKQQAQEAIRAVIGCRRLVNRITVSRCS